MAQLLDLLIVTPPPALSDTIMEEVVMRVGEPSSHDPRTKAYPTLTQPRIIGNRQAENQKIWPSGEARVSAIRAWPL